MIRNTICKNVADKILSGCAKMPIKLSVVAELYIRYWKTNFLVGNDEANKKLDPFWLFLEKLQKDSGVCVIDDDNFCGDDFYGDIFTVKACSEQLELSHKTIPIKLTDSKYLKKLKKFYNEKEKPCPGKTTKK